MDGPLFNGYSTPGTSFYDSGLFSVGSPTPRSTFVFTAGSDFAAGGLYVPSSDITWSVQFTGLGTGDDLGVDIYSPPTVGSDFPDWWENTGSGWTLNTNNLPMNFAASAGAGGGKSADYLVSGEWSKKAECWEGFRKHVIPISIGWEREWADSPFVAGPTEMDVCSGLAAERR